ncbi:PAS domain S-box protein [Sphingosinicellaceae bacterium]|nr:PAS domain S-box protein [Sphingosinicellaceae bacterium]
MDRLLILATQGRAAGVIRAQLAAAGIPAHIEESDAIVAEIRAGTLAAAIIADEGLISFDHTAIRSALALQPSWSDHPFLLLTRKNFRGFGISRATELFGNVTILERPLSTDALISATRSALRARARQRAAEADLLARQQAEDKVRALATTLEARELTRTGELRSALEEQAQTQSKLRDSEELYRLTIELSGQIPWVSNAQGRLLAIGEGLVARTGMPHAALRGYGLLAILHPDDRETALSVWYAAADSAEYESTFRLPAVGGGYRWYRSRGARSLLADRGVPRWYGTMEDIDDHKTAEMRLDQMQQELVEASRLSAMGAMASILAHELNQPLTAITGYVRGSRRMLETAAPIAPVIDALVAADHSAVRAGEIVRRARDLIHGGSAARRLEPVAALIREAVALATDGGRWPGIYPRIDVDDTVADIYVDRVQIQQVLINLIRNALEAMANTHCRNLSLVAYGLPGAFCEITVSDTGHGIAPEMAAELFNPFNSSKPGGQGIGLSISRSIVEAHGGHIWARPGEHCGTVFGFTVPNS